MSEQIQDPDTTNKVEELVSMLQYQPDSIVSRVLLKSNAGSITLFAFDQGEGLSEHTAPFDAFVSVLEGEADVEIVGKGYKVGKGESLKLPANKPHAVKAASRCKMLLIMIRA